MMNRAAKSQSGFTLIELMIALMLSLIITIALIGLFINSKRNYEVNESMSRLQENARFAISFLSRDLRMADYRACITEDRLDNAVVGVKDAGLNSSDTVTILWQSNDCGDASAVVTTVYTIQAGASGSPALFRSIDGNNRELVEGIEDLEVLFGQDVDEDFVPDYYVDASAITDWKQVIGINFKVVARTLEANMATSGARITRDFTSTIALRNRLP